MKQYGQAPPKESRPRAHQPSTDGPERRPPPVDQPNRSSILADADNPTTNVDSPAALDRGNRHAGNPNRPSRTWRQTDRTRPDQRQRSGRPHERRLRRQIHRGAARSSQEHAACRHANESKMVATEHQQHPDRHPTPSTGHVLPRTRDLHVRRLWRTTTARESYADLETRGNSALVNSPTQTGLQHIGPAIAACIPRGC